MEIKLNNKTLDVNLEKENTLGEILAGLEQWLSSSGHRIVELNIDGKPVNASMMETIFSKEIKDIAIIDIHTNVIAELSAASLLNLLEDIDEFEELSHDKKSEFFNNWKETPAACFIYSEMTDLFAYCVNTFSNGEMSCQTLRTITEEIQREVTTPVSEFTKIEPVLDEICERLVRLPLDIQTGKDAQAAQTIQLFSAISEKIFRIYRQLDTQGYFFNKTNTDNSEDSIKRKYIVSEKITDFTAILRDLLDAYEKNDSVLVGDLTEYEASPKLKELYDAVFENIQDKE